jgi:hypothetical protein
MTLADFPLEAGLRDYEKSGRIEAGLCLIRPTRPYSPESANKIETEGARLQIARYQPKTIIAALRVSAPRERAVGRL